MKLFSQLPLWGITPLQWVLVTGNVRYVGEAREKKGEGRECHHFFHREGT